MGAISSTLRPDNRTASQDEQGRYTYSAVYDVITEDPDDDALVATELGQGVGPDPIPAHMSVYALGESIDFSAFRQGLSAVQVDDRRTWRVTVTWSPLPEGKSPLETQTSFDNPILRPQRHWSEFQTITEVVEQDHQNKPIVNSAGQPFDEPVEEDNEYEVLVFEKNFATAGEIRNLNRSFRRKLNSDSFGGYSARHCLCLPIRTSPPQFENGVQFYRATFRVLCSDRPWEHELVNRGFKHFAGTGQDQKLVLATDPILDDNGNEINRSVVVEPVLLTDDNGPDGPGYRLAQGVEGNVLKFQTRGEVAFAGLPVSPPA